MIRRFPNKIADIIAAKRIRLNTISKASGISHTHLTKIVKGNINRPGKGTIASILLSLNFSITDINSVLAVYDYRLLNKFDIPDILENNKKRKIEGNTQAQYHLIYFDLLLSALERIGGTKILVKNRPSGIFQPEMLYLKREYPYTNSSSAGTFLYDLTLALFRERRELFRRNCGSGNRYETYICLQCLDDFLKKNLGRRHKTDKNNHRELVVMYFANAISILKSNPLQHHTKIIERCSYFHFQLQNADGDSPKVLLTGRKLHNYSKEYDRLNLAGFTSNAPNMIDPYREEIDLCNKTVLADIDRDYPDNLIDFLLQRFDRFGLKQALQSAIDDLMTKPALSLY